MNRIRLSFVLLALLLLAPLALLLSRTIATLERERELRHESVARRVFDETERVLTEFLAEEELRSPEEYFSRLPDGRASPLSLPPQPDFIVDHFQIDRSGVARSPRSEGGGGRADELARLAEASRNRKDQAARERGGRELRLGKLHDFEATGDPQAPGSTRTVQKLDLMQRSELVLEDDALEEEVLAAKESDEYTSFGVLEQLNRGGLSRSKKKVARDVERQEGARTAARMRQRTVLSYEADQGMVDAAGSSPADSVLLEAAVPAKTRADGAPSGSARDFASAAPATRASSSIPAAPSIPTAAPMPAEAPVLDDAKGFADEAKVELGDSPMAGFAIDDDRLVLYRTVILPGRGSFQQGLILDVERFADWIEERVVGESGLSQYITLDLRSAPTLGASSPLRGGHFVYDHRFSEPFEALAARLFLAPLPDTGGSGNVYAMGLLLLVVSTLGLWAMYRRVAVAVHFAERRSNFAAAVSHELKTPLTAIRMYGEMLRDGMVPDEAKRQEYYATISSEAERLTRLINNVLEFSKLERRKRTLDLPASAVEPCLRDVIRILEPHAHSRGFVLSLEIEPPLPAVRFESDALQQVLFNLIDNALKYAADAERKEIAVRAGASERGVVITVRDWGPGVMSKHRRHLFEPFYRGESELTRRTKGTGIGLALVKGLVEEMGGAISAGNVADGGFEVELRLQG